MRLKTLNDVKLFLQGKQLTLFPEPEEAIRDWHLPAPDEAPVTECPWCGQEYSVMEDQPEEDFKPVCEPIPGCSEISRHRCGHLVRLISWAEDIDL